MPRPCFEEHPSSPDRCRICFWCADDSTIGEQYRRAWGEPEPAPSETNARAAPIREIVPGLPDPIPMGELDPLPPRWSRDARIVKKHRDALRRLVQAEMPSPGARQGAGVLLIGGGRYWPGLVIAVKMLRDAGSQLPVQIWHRGSDEAVYPEDLTGVPGVEIRDLTALTPRPRILRGWDAKTLAILASGWERVFFLDADAYCVDDPTAVLDRLSLDEPFLYWQDYPSGEAVNWYTWGFEQSSAKPVQGGQFAIHTRHFWRELVIAHWLNQHSDFSYSHQFGDQDSWRVALTATSGRSACLGAAMWDDIAFVCSMQGRPLVVHRCQSKMLYPEDVAKDDSQSNRRDDRLPGEARAWKHWHELMSRRPAPAVFGQIYSKGLWGPGETSGSGSTPQEAAPYLDLVNGLFKIGGIRRVIDLGCGDGYVAARITAPEVVGVDCHLSHIQRLRELHPHREWHNLDLDRDREKLPSGEIALLKDVLHHWPNRLVRDWLSWARTCGKWRWLICTQDGGQSAEGDDCLLGGYRALDLAMEPLSGLGLEPFSQFRQKKVLVLAVTG